MASKKRPVNKNQRLKSNNTLSQFGIEIPDVDMNDDDSDENDEDLEDELEALLSGKVVNRRAPKPPKEPVLVNIDEMAVECMKDIGSGDDEDDSEDKDLSGDEELMAELQSLTSSATNSNSLSGKNDCKIQSSVTSEINEMPPIIGLLQKRLALYKEAEAVSKAAGESSKARRYGRGIKTLESLLASAKRGVVIQEEDIPPEVVVPKQQSSSVPDAPVDISNVVAQSIEENDDSSPKYGGFSPKLTTADVPNQSQAINDLPVSEMESVHQQLVTRRNQYKLAALKAKRCGDNETALQYVRIAKKFDAVIEAEKSGQPIDLSEMPPPPPDQGDILVTKIAQPGQKESSEMQTHAADIEAAALAAADDSQSASVFDAPPAPKSILEALEQRLQKYCSTRDNAKAEGNNSKARRLSRIVQQYEKAIKDYKAGKPIAFDELPTPPGFAPIPDGSAKPSAAVSQEDQPSVPETVSSSSEKHSLPYDEKATSPPAATSKGPLPGRTKKLQRANTSTILEKQLSFLLERQKLFRQAALESKKKGDIQQAKEYLRMSKGFDSMIEATRSGLPIDATSIPTPPQLETDYVIIDESECMNNAVTGSKDDIFRNLEKELQNQIEMCSRNKDHFLRLGDVSSASKFEKLGLDTKKDLAVVQYQWRNGDAVPRFHYETRLFSMVQCHTDLSDNDLEVTVERGINLPGKPDELDSYVKIELPIPSETPQRAKTHTVRDTNNPIFQEIFKFEINRKSRSQIRQFKRQSLKLEVWSKGGFFRGDTLLGTAMVKLVTLESKCSIHDSFDLLMGRKVCGGKLEVKVRVRDPLLAKQVEEVREKWLVVGS